MAGFGGHITFGVVTAVTYASSIFLWTTAPMDVVYTAFVVTMFSSMLPDIDSDSGLPVYLVFGGLSLLTMGLCFDYLRQGRTIDAQGFLLSVGAGLGVFVLVQYLFKKMTTHRGVFHTIPMALIFGLMTMTLLSYYEMGVESMVVLAGAVLAGYLCHLLLDELNSLGIGSGFVLKPKKSLGTALKLTGYSARATAVMYVVLCYLVYWNKAILYGLGIYFGIIA